MRLAILDYGATVTGFTLAGHKLLMYSEKEQSKIKENMRRIFFIAALTSLITLHSGGQSLLEEDSSSEEILEELSGYPWGDSEDENVIIPTVITPVGTFLGLMERSRNGMPFYTFKGIPYAEPPKRFKAANPKRPMPDAYDSRYDRPQCAQLPETGLGEPIPSGSEDCLYLSVSFPHYERCGQEKLNVMFWIHPGNYKFNNGSVYKAHYLMDACVVFVSINYRLGALGFLSTGDDVIPGNLGLKDQVLALKWTKRNIRYFRGDESKVTIFGCSAGASSVSHHLFSPTSVGLFHNAISMSGIILNPWSIAENPVFFAKALAEALSCPTESSIAIKKCLLSKTTEELVRRQDDIAPPDIAFAPILEPKWAKNPFQTQQPYKLLLEGNFTKVPYMTGFVEQEGVYFGERIIQNPLALQGPNAFFSTWAPKQLFYSQLNIPDDEREAITENIKLYYFDNFPISPAQRQAFMDLVSDRIFIQGIYETVNLMAKLTPIYLYLNTYKGGLSFASLFGVEVPVITHTDDEQYLFPVPRAIPAYGTEQYEYSLRMVELWTNFAKFGKPFGKATETIPWLQVDGKPYRRLYNLDMPTRILHNYKRSRTKFWRRLGIYKYEFNYEPANNL